MDPSRLHALLAPRSIAFVGASGRENTPGRDMLRMVRRGGFGGVVHAVNPNHRELEGYPCVPRLSDLPERPDLAVLAVKNERLEDALAEAAALGTPGAVIFASGVLPGTNGSALSGRLADIARSAGMLVCGPNCMGFYNDLDRVWVCGFPSPRQPGGGSIALVAQSGSVFGALAHNDPRLGLALAVSPGSELTATVADYLAYAVARPEVKAVGLFLEAARDPAGFAAALGLAAQRGVPVVVLKVGRTEAAAAAALTHTGALAGSDLAYEALFDRHGAIRVETLDELAATLLLLSGRRAAPGGLVSIHDSGGEREMTIDLAERAGVPFAAISPATEAAIAPHLDPGLEAKNPLDAWGTGQDFVAHFTASFDALLADRDAGIGLFCADLRDGSYLYRGFADAALAAAARTEKPVAVATSYTQVRHDALALELTRAGVPVLDGTANALAAVRGALRHRDALARRPDPPPAPPPERREARAAARQGLGQGPLDEAGSLALLAAWGVPAIGHALASDEAAALAAAERLGWPVVLKTATAGILHKSDVGGVVLGLRDAAALAAAWRDLARRLGPRVLVAATAPRGVELSLGMVRDPQFGPIVTIGAGGTLVELLDDRVGVLAPFGPATARRHLDRLRLRRLLDGHRGSAPVDMDRLSAIVAAFSVLAADLGDLVAEIDVNPLIAGERILALDALVVARPRP